MPRKVNPVVEIAHGKFHGRDIIRDIGQADIQGPDQALQVGNGNRRADIPGNGRRTEHHIRNSFVHVRYGHGCVLFGLVRSLVGNMRDFTIHHQRDERISRLFHHERFEIAERVGMLVFIAVG